MVVARGRDIDLARELLKDPRCRILCEKIYCVLVGREQLEQIEQGLYDRRHAAPNEFLRDVASGRQRSDKGCGIRKLFLQTLSLKCNGRDDEARSIEESSAAIFGGRRRGLDPDTLGLDQVDSKRDIVLYKPGLKHCLHASVMVGGILIMRSLLYAFRAWSDDMIADLIAQPLRNPSSDLAGKVFLVERTAASGDSSRGWSVSNPADTISQIKSLSAKGKPLHKMFASTVSSGGGAIKNLVKETLEDPRVMREALQSTLFNRLSRFDEARRTFESSAGSEVSKMPATATEKVVASSVCQRQAARVSSSPSQSKTSRKRKSEAVPLGNASGRKNERRNAS